MRRSSQAGMTLIEVMIAVTLFALLSVGIMMALRVGMTAMERSSDRLMTNRRAAYSSRILQSELNGFMPEWAVYQPTPQSPIGSMPFFQGEPDSMRFISTYSLQSASRGIPQILEFHVIPGDQGRGVRLIVNEVPYTGPVSAGVFCIGYVLDPATSMRVPLFRPIQVGGNSFVIADKLAYCRFAFQAPGFANHPPGWTERWVTPAWPLAIRMEMAPLDPDPSRLQPMTVTSAVHVTKSLETQYVDN